MIDGLQGKVIASHVDDGSTDATASLARRAGADVLEHGTNRGKGRDPVAIERVVAATSALILDGDSDLPGEAPLLLEAAART